MDNITMKLLILVISLSTVISTIVMKLVTFVISKNKNGKGLDIVLKREERIIAFVEAIVSALNSINEKQSEIIRQLEDIRNSTNELEKNYSIIDVKISNLKKR